MVFLGRRSRTKSDLSLKMYQEEIQVRANTLGDALLVGAWEGSLCSVGPRTKSLGASVLIF